jgi:putative two-component system response regulator
MSTPLRVLMIEDCEDDARLLRRALRQADYELTHARVDTPAAMCAALDREGWDLVISDYSMRSFSGPAALDILKERGLDIPFIIVSEAIDEETAVASLKAGAHEFVTKGKISRLGPAVERELREAEVRRARHRAEESLRESQDELRQSREETILRLARAAEERDDETGSHIQRMSQYCGLLAKKAGLDPNHCELIRLASIMHDVGKIGIPDRILLKPGQLTLHEFNIMKQHTDIGHRILIGSKAELLQTADVIAWSHHEKYDGSGYPRSLAGEAIPLEGRIAAIADVFDALTSKRVYKPAQPIDKAIAIMREGRGKHFDPRLLDLFLEAIDQILVIKEHYTDVKETRSFPPFPGFPVHGTLANTPATRDA